MRRATQRTTPKLSTDSRRLVALVQTAMTTASRLESNFWEKSFEDLVTKLLKSRHQDALDAALDYLFTHDLDAYDMFIEATEAHSESCILTHEGQDYDVLLIAAPVLAWTRFSIPSGILPATMHARFADVLRQHIMAPDAKLALAPSLHAIEQLPHNHSEVFALTQHFGLCALQNKPIEPPKENAATVPFLADTRYMIAAVVVPRGTPVFAWQAAQDPMVAQEHQLRAENAWSAEIGPLVSTFLPGCNVTPLLPQAYYYSCREADKYIRPASVQAACHYLSHNLNTTPDQLQVCVGKFSHDMDGEIDEYRIGYTHNDNEVIFYGTVWPLYESEDGDDVDVSLVIDHPQPHPMELIRATLKECGITDIKEHAEIFAAEFCEDCGSPLFPNREGDLVHAEMPEDVMTIEQLH